MAVRPSVKRTKIDMTSLKIYIRGEKKTGKSTLFRDLILEKFGDPEKGLLIGFGAEVGYELLDNLNSVQVENYADFKELVTWLITQKGKEHDIRMVAFDTVDELLPILEKEVCRLSTIETKKPCKSINSAFSGFGAGQERLKQLLKEAVVMLSKAGITPFAIAHTKVKTVKEKGMTEDEGGLAFFDASGTMTAWYRNNNTPVLLLTHNTSSWASVAHGSYYSYLLCACAGQGNRVVASTLIPRAFISTSTDSANPCMAYLEGGYRVYCYFSGGNIYARTEGINADCYVKVYGMY